jgi:hypothetical protein
MTKVSLRRKLLQIFIALSASLWEQNMIVIVPGYNIAVIDFSERAFENAAEVQRLAMKNEL